ncbi:MAG: class I SAM-dependent methyltransferase [Paracoccaceae bacterium]
MYKAEKFWDRIANRYAKSSPPNEAAYQEKLTLTRRYFTPQSQVLELGCGTGVIAISHAPFVQHIDGVDVSPKMLEIARNRAMAMDVSNVTFTCANIEAFWQNGAVYDVIMGHNILHLLKDKEAVIARIYDMLKPGGVFVSNTACISAGNLFVRIGLASGNRLGLLPPVRFFSADDLVQSLTNAGFTIDYQWQPENSETVFIVAKK